METVVYEREKLYEEVWKESVSVVAKRYGISDNALRKHCMKLNVPLPPRGYWAQLKAGVKVIQTPLPKGKGLDRIVIWGHKRNPEERVKRKDERLDYMTDEKSSQILTLCETITVPTEISMLHHYVKGLYSKGKRKDEITERIIRIKDTIYKVFTDLGYKITEDGKFVIGSEVVGVSVIQQKKQVPHEYTKDELRRKERYGYINTPKYDYLDTDMLTIHIDEDEAKRKNWNDTEKKQVEQSIGDIIIGIIETAEYKRIEREKREEQHRKWVEEEKRRKRLKYLRAKDTKKYGDLEKKAADYRTSKLIMDYVAALEGKLNTIVEVDEKEKARSYIEWAKGKADWLNPLINKEDPLFGLRHEELFPEFNEDEEHWELFY